jgi:hypothetical protein
MPTRQAVVALHHASDGVHVPELTRADARIPPKVGGMGAKCDRCLRSERARCISWRIPIVRTAAMRTAFRTALLALAAGLALPLAVSAGTGQSSFGVGLKVLPAGAQSAALPTLPVPQGSQVLALDAARGSWVNGSDLETVAAFYESSMPALGFRLATRQDDATGARLTWDDGAGTRVEVQIRRMLGQADGSWIVATAA